MVYLSERERQGTSTLGRLYHVCVKNERTGQEIVLSHEPVTHSQGCAWLKKITDYGWRRKYLREVAT